MLNRDPDAHWSRLSEFIAETMGLHFPPERWADMQRSLAGVASELGFENAAAYADWLLSTPPSKAELDVLAAHLTIGETYFFRERETLGVLADSILPELIRSRRGGEQRLRIWSAACCSGEEPYSLAILLHQLLPDLEHWRVTITATDINPRFLHKAAAGLYGEWSFRGVPAGIKKRYFNRAADGRCAIVPEIKRLVSFGHLNLVEDNYPSLATDTNAMDVILCRNVLMYFTPPQVRKAIRNLHRALVEGGWLAVSPSEASHALFPQFVAENFPGAILYCKSDAKLRDRQSATWNPPRQIPKAVTPEAPSPRVAQMPATRPTQPPPVLLLDEPAPAETPAAPYAAAESLYQQGSYAEAAAALLAAFPRGTPGPQGYSLLARALANQGELAAALTWCDRWVAADKLNPACHYLRAVILMEQGDVDRARSALQRSVYLEPGFVLAHFALGNLAHGRGSFDQAEKHFANALLGKGRDRPWPRRRERRRNAASERGVGACPRQAQRRTPAVLRAADERAGRGSGWLWKANCVPRWKKISSYCTTSQSSTRAAGQSPDWRR